MARPALRSVYYSKDRHHSRLTTGPEQPRRSDRALSHSTQPRELQGVLMPYQTHKMFTLSGTEGKGAAKFPIKLPPGGSHTQAVKFTSRPHQQGIFKHTMLFNFSNWVRAILARNSGAQFGAQFARNSLTCVPSFAGAPRLPAPLGVRGGAGSRSGRECARGVV